MLALVLIVSGMCFKLVLLSRDSLSFDMPSIDNLTAGMGDSIAGHIVQRLSDTVSNTSKLWLEEAVPVANGSLLPDDGQETWDVVVVGAGLAGAVIADLYAHSGKRVLVLEKRGHIGGSCYDARDADSGILASMHGIRVLATNQERVWRYVHRHGAWEHYEHRAAALPSPQPGARLVPFSVNIEAVRMLDNSSVTSVESMREWGRKRKAGALSVNASNAAESLRDIAGEKLYGALLKPHLENVWGVDPLQLEASVSDSVPASWNWDDRYFPGHQWQGVPREGYTRWFERALDHPRIKVMLDTDYYEVRLIRREVEVVFGLVGDGEREGGNE
jgi:UDP-galactopyranose mutase